MGEHVTEADIGKRVRYVRGRGFDDFQGCVGTLVRVEPKQGYERPRDWVPAALWWVVDWDVKGEHRHFNSYLEVTPGD